MGGLFTDSALCWVLGVNSITQLSYAAGTEGDFLPCKLEAVFGPVFTMNLCSMWLDGRLGGGGPEVFPLKYGA